ncbi:MAG: TetR/AcrR family transcriptional regulator [Acidimicrobiales bacterium]|nr:TetR/AcrR family transcriptional regulator [Acidimicrobiales bacterium]
MPRSATRSRVTDIEEVKRLAMAQVAAGGIHSLSMNAIARELGVTGPALYRYVAGRDELVTLLLVDTYTEFATTLEEAAAGDDEPRDRLRAVGVAYRRWALAHPERFDLLFGTPLPDYEAPEQTRELARRGLEVQMRLRAEIDGLDPAGPEALALAVRGWARLHGFVDLERSGHFDEMPVDAEALFADELDSLLAL